MSGFAESGWYAAAGLRASRWASPSAGVPFGRDASGILAHAISISHYRDLSSGTANFFCPAHIGILGFSAGGHLASTAATHHDDGNAEAKDPIDRAGCRPDFAVLVYPVISLTTKYTHQGSKNNLLGKDPDAKLVESLSNEKQVTAKTPPTFLMATSGDTGVPAENSILFYMALREHKVKAEMHIYQNGGHGFGLAPNDPVLSTWPGRCEAWMRVNGFLTPPK